MAQARDAAVELLRQTDNPAADQLLTAMLATEDPAAQNQAIEVILDRGWTAGMVQIIARFAQFRADVTAPVIARARDLSAAIRQTIRDNRTEVRVNTVEIIRRSCDPSLAYLLTVGLRDGHAGIRRAAADGLETFVRTYLHESTAPRGDGGVAHWRVRRETRRKICDALAEAVESFHVHGEQGVLRSAMLLADPACAPLWACLQRHHDNRADLMLDLLAAADDAELVDFFYQALALGEHRGRLLNVLRRAICGPFLKAALSRGYLLATPAVADAVGRLRGMDLLDGGVGWIDELPLEARRHLARFILTSGVPDPQKEAVLARLAESPAAAERANALDAALAMPPSPAVEELIHGLLSDPDERVQRIATRGIVYRDCPQLQQLLVRQLNSSFESVRRIASRRLAAYTFEHYWEVFDRLGEPQRVAAGRALQKLDPALEDRLRSRLTRGDEEDQLRAMEILRLLGLEAACSQQLMNLARSDAAKVRATAVRLLGRVHNPDAIERTSAALADVDPRVQANAVESLEQQADPMLAEKLRPMLDTADNRIVANAAKALAANLAEAIPAIQRLLADRRPAYRLSGLWVVGQIHLPELFREVVRLCREDENHRVRSRAIEILTQIRNSISQGDAR